MLINLLALLAMAGGHKPSEFIAPLPYAELVGYVDKLDAEWIAEIGTSSAGLGLGDSTFGASLKQVNMQSLVSGSGNITSQAVLAPIVRPWPNNTAALAYATQNSSFFGGLTQLANQTGVANTIDGLLTYYNTGAGGTWNCLAPPEWVSIYSAVEGTAPTPTNVYAPVSQGSEYTVGLGSYVKSSSTFTKATGSVGVLNSSGNIDVTKYAGGFPTFQWSGASGSGTITITVVGLNQSGVAETFVYTGAYAASSSGVVLVGQTTSTDLISGATSVTTSSTGTFTGFTGYVDAVPPTGRTYPPT